MSYLLNYKKWSALYEELKANEDAAGTENAPDEDLPKDLDARIKYLVDKSVKSDSEAIKNTAIRNGRRPWDAIMDWMYARGKPGKENKKIAYLLSTSPELANKFENMKPTMEKEDMARCMEQWHGIFDSKPTAINIPGQMTVNGKVVKTDNTYGGDPDLKLSQIKQQLEKLSTPSFVDRLIARWKKADGYPDGKAIGQFTFPNKFKIFGKDVTFTGPDILFDKALIVENSKILLDKLTEVTSQSGKSPRTGLTVDYTKTDTEYTTNDAKSMCLAPNTTEFNKELSVEELSKLGDRDKVALTKKRFSAEATANFFIWYTIISDKELFKALVQKLENPTYIRTDFVKMTDQDKINIINGIMEMSTERWKKSKYVSPAEAIYWASSIMWWPEKAKETMPVVSTASSSITKTQSDEPVEITNTYDFAWPYANKNGGKDLAITYFKNDSAQIQDGKAQEIQKAVNEIMAEIKAKNGTLTKLTYKVVASTSDEPSKYQQSGVIGGNWDPNNNNYLVVARANVIETALQAALTSAGVDKTLVKKEPDELSANNTLDGKAVYETMKWMRLSSKDARATTETNNEYLKIFAEPKHSGILFSLEYTTTEIVKDDPTVIIEDDKDVTQGYSVTGEWRYGITWKGGSSSGKRRGRRSHTKRAWKTLAEMFPPRPARGGWGVHTLCCAYGNC